MSGFPEKVADLREKSRKRPGKSGELLGKSGKLLGNLWIAVKFTERTSGEVASGLPGKSGDVPEAWGSLTPSQRLTKFVSNWASKEGWSRFWAPPT